MIAPETASWRTARLFPEGVHRTFKLNKATPYPSGVVSLDYARDRPTA